MTGLLIAEKFNLANRAKLWALRAYHGKIYHGYCDPLGRTMQVTEEHADRLIAAGKNVYVDIPYDTEDKHAPQSGASYQERAR